MVSAGPVIGARALILVAAFTSFVVSVVLWFGGHHQEGTFVGLWVLSILSLWWRHWMWTNPSGAISRSAAPTCPTYAQMLDRMAEALGLPHRPRIPVPLIRPWSSLWIGLVTPVDAGVARPLIEGLAIPTVVADPSGMELFDIEPIGFEEALRSAVADDPELVAA